MMKRPVGEKHFSNIIRFVWEIAPEPVGSRIQKKNGDNLQFQYFRAEKDLLAKLNVWIVPSRQNLSYF